MEAMMDSKQARTEATALDHLVFESARETIRAQQDLELTIANLAHDTDRDLKAVQDGRFPWHSPGTYCRAASEVDLAHRGYRDAWEKLRAVVYAVRETAPYSHAGVAWAIASAFAGVR